MRPQASVGHAMAFFARVFFVRPQQRDSQSSRAQDLPSRRSLRATVLPTSCLDG